MGDYGKFLNFIKIEYSNVIHKEKNTMSNAHPPPKM